MLAADWPMWLPNTAVKNNSGAGPQARLPGGSGTFIEVGVAAGYTGRGGGSGQGSVGGRVTGDWRGETNLEQR